MLGLSFQSVLEGERTCELCVVKPLVGIQQPGTKDATYCSSLLPRANVNVWNWNLLWHAVFYMLVNEGKGRVGEGFVWPWPFFSTCWSVDQVTFYGRSMWEMVSFKVGVLELTLNCSAEGKLPCLTVRSPACVYCGGFAYFVLKREWVDFLTH